MARRNPGGSGRVVRGEQLYCPVQSHPAFGGGAFPPLRLEQPGTTETPRMRSASIRTVGNLSYAGDRSLASGERVYERGVMGQTRSSGPPPPRPRPARADKRVR